MKPPFKLPVQTIPSAIKRPQFTPPVASPVYRPLSPQGQVQRKADMKQPQPPAKPPVSTMRTPVAPPVYRPQQPKIVQPKVAISQQRNRPQAPPVYRPQPKTIVQPKMATTSGRRPPSAPPVYRPSQKQILQPKSALTPRPPQPANQRSGNVVQPVILTAKKQDRANGNVIVSLGNTTWYKKLPNDTYRAFAETVA